MASRFALPTNALTARERDCLRLLGRGLSSADVVRDLGIKQSTLESHLASARRKLGVATTRQAVLITTASAGSGSLPAWPGRLHTLADQSSRNADFANALRRCGSLQAAWRVVVAQADDFGAAEATFGLIAEPQGRLTNGGRMLLSSFVSEDCNAPVAGRDDMAHNPVGAYAALNAEGRIFDNEDFATLMAGNPNPQLRSIANAYLERGLSLHYCQPGRDQGTSAPYIFFWSLDKGADTRGSAGRREAGDGLGAISHLFWEVVQERRWLVAYSGLSNGHREALQLLARGFLNEEAAEQLGLSQRGYEKQLSSARACLGARTNAQAVYRATVYRAL